jgi:hypothetical protein
MKVISVIILLIMCGSLASAHQMTPTYPELTYSQVSGVLKATVNIFNKREDVEYFEISVFDKDWNSITFATESRIVKIPYLRNKRVDIYIRASDKDHATYICSMSKIESNKATSSSVYSRICSKIKSK